MGYIIEEIAEYTEPAPLTIAGRPSFFSMVGFTEATPVPYLRTVRFKQENYEPEDDATVVLILPDGNRYDLRPTKELTEVNGTTFYVDNTPSRTAENLKAALLSISYLADNFDVNILSVPGMWGTGAMESVINIKSKGSGEAYTLVWQNEDGTPDEPAEFWAFTGGAPSFNYDEVTEEKETALIQLDVYTGMVVILGQSDFPDTAAKLGQLAVTLKKNYIAGLPGGIWFDVNAMFSKSTNYNTADFQNEGDFIFNPETLHKYRFDVKVRDSKGVRTVYRSRVLWVLNGFSELYDTAGDELYARYVFNGQYIVKPLTNQPRITYIPGQPVFINFLIGDPARVDPLQSSDIVSPYMQFFTQSGDYLTDKFIELEVPYGEINDINTFRIDPAPYIREAQEYVGRDVGIIKVCALKDGLPITEFTEFTVKPSNTGVDFSPLHDDNYFIFLNALGGFDSFNFDAQAKKEIRANIETYSKTITPQSIQNKAQSVETVYANDADEVITIEGAPINRDVYEWLREMVNSRVILHKGRYVIVQDLSLSSNPDNASMPIPTIKFKYSDTWRT